VAKIVDTGMFRTVMPEHRGDLLSEVVDRISETPFLEFTSVARDQALSEITKAGFPAEPGPDDWCNAPPHIIEAYRLLEAGKELEVRLEPLLSSTGVLKAVLTALIETYGDAPRQLRGELIVTPRDEPGALEELFHIIDAAIGLGILCQRLESRQHEPTFVSGKKSREGGKKGNLTAYHKEQQEHERRQYQAEYDRVAKDHPGMSRLRIATLVAEKFGRTYKTIQNHTHPKK
jgi:hypothetical protein